MNFNIFNSIILAGVIQGLLFGAIVILSKKYKHKSVYFLTAVIVIYSLSNLQFYFNDIGLITYDELLAYYYIPWGNTVPLLLYCYVASYLNSDFKFSRKEYLLFIPFIFSFTLSIIYKIANGLQLENNWVSHLKYYLDSYDDLLTALFHVVIFSVLFIKINNYSIKQNSFDASQVKLHVKWLKGTFIVYSFLLVLFVTLTILYVIYPGQISFYPLWIAMAAIIYWFGHMGIYKYGVVEQRKQIRKKKLQKPEASTGGKTKHIIIERLKHYLVDKKQFLDASLTLEKTAEALELSQGHLSKIINTELQISFKDYLNELRVEEAKNYLKDSDFSNYTLVAIGLEAGFNSKSAFNSSFKKIAGVTPSQFKQRHIN